MKVLILGANGKVGSMVARRLLRRGHSIVAGVHKNKTNVPRGAEIIALDITDQSSVERALSGCDAVVCALSSWHAPHHDVLGKAMRIVIPAMDKAGVRRIVSISGDVARVSGEKPGVAARFFHALAFGFVRKVVRDSEDHIKQLQKSNLDWTVLRPGVMTRSDRADYRLLARHPRSPFISRRAVAEAIVDQLEEPTYVRQSPFITSR